MFQLRSSCQKIYTKLEGKKLELNSRYLTKTFLDIENIFYPISIWWKYNSPNWTSWIARIARFTIFHKFITVTNFIYFILVLAVKFIVTICPWLPSIFPMSITAIGFQTHFSNNLFKFSENAFLSFTLKTSLNRSWLQLVIAFQSYF